MRNVTMTFYILNKDLVSTKDLIHLKQQFLREKNGRFRFYVPIGKPIFEIRDILLECTIREKAQIITDIMRWFTEMYDNPELNNPESLLHGFMDINNHLHLLTNPILRCPLTANNSGVGTDHIVQFTMITLILVEEICFLEWIQMLIQ